MIICISVKAWATVQSFWMVINLYKITRDLEWPMTSDVGIPMASYHNHPEDSCTVFHKLSHETIQPLGYHDNRNPNGWWNASSYDQWPSYETPGGMDLPWHGHFFLSDTAADAAEFSRDLRSPGLGKCRNTHGRKTRWKLFKTQCGREKYSELYILFEIGQFNQLCSATGPAVLRS